VWHSGLKFREAVLVAKMAEGGEAAAAPTPAEGEDTASWLAEIRELCEVSMDAEVCSAPCHSSASSPASVAIKTKMRLG
jgi:hypothetical protein